MDAIDQSFISIVEANPHLRPRVGNPDEMKSNRMLNTLAALKFRVTDPEPGVPEALGGAVVTALNEEAVVSAALANKGGINIVVTYEAFAVKMLGALRQEIIFAAALKENGRPARWLAVPVVLTSHTYENGKNELSHQDPTMAEALMGETADVSRVVFPADYNSAATTMQAIYSSRGESGESSHQREKSRSCWPTMNPRSSAAMAPLNFSGPPLETAHQKSFSRPSAPTSL